MSQINIDHPVATRTRSRTKRKADALTDEGPQVKQKQVRFRGNGDIMLDQLPNELLLEIFSKMDRGTLKACVQVNKKWNDLITKTHETMQMMPLYISNSFIVVHGNPKLTRKYQEVTLNEVVLKNNEISKELTGIGGTVTSLTLYDCWFYGSDFVDLVLSFPNLKFLKIFWCEPVYPFDVNSGIAELKNLKTIEIQGDIWLLTRISCNIKELIVIEAYQDDQDILLEFLRSQTSLESLHLLHINDLFTAESQPKFLFQLKELVLIDLPFADTKNLMSLMERSKEVKTLCIRGSVAPCALVFAIKNFLQLENLDIDASLLPQFQSFYVDLKANGNLKHLKIGGRPKTSENLLCFMSHYPNVEKLHMTSLACDINGNVWKLISATITKVKYLSIKKCTSKTLMMMKFPALRSLEIDIITSKSLNAWSEFNKNNPNLESLRIHMICCRLSCQQQRYKDLIQNVLWQSLENLKEVFTCLCCHGDLQIAL